MRNIADSQADVERFIKRVAESDQVWYLTSRNGPAVSTSNDVERYEEPPVVILFFSDRAYAKRALAKSFTKHEVASMKLFDFLFRWLPGMSRDGKLAGPNWTGELVGLEIDPFELREQIEDSMSDEHKATHEQEFKRLTSQ